MFKWNTKETTMPEQWLPPENVMRRVANLIQFQIEYLQTLGKHDADMPNFTSKPCLKKTSTGEIEYDFGPDACMPLVPQTMFVTPKKNKKRMQIETPKKGNGRKKTRTSTPRQIKL